MAIKDSLRALGVSVSNLKDLVVGVNKLLLPRDQKLALLKRYEIEEGVTIPPELQKTVV